jgi:hypothetical protein
MIINNNYKSPAISALTQKPKPVTFGIPQYNSTPLQNSALGTTKNSTTQSLVKQASLVPTSNNGFQNTSVNPVQNTSSSNSGLVSTNRNTPVTAPNPEATPVTLTGEKRMLKSERDRLEQEKKGLLKADKTSLGGILDRLQGKSNASSEQQRLNRRIEEEAAQSRLIADQARQYSEMYGDEIARVGQLGAGAVAGNLSTGTNVVGSGNANLASQAASSRMSALSQAQQAALQGTSQQLTGQGQLQAALGQAAGNLNTQQQQGISALGTAGNLAMPNPAQYGQTVFDPVTGQFTGGNLDPQTQATNLAQQVMSGAMTYDQAIASLGYAGSAGTNFLNNAITGAGGNPLQLQASGAAQQANVTTSGTAGTDIARSGLQDATQTYVQMSTAANTAHEQANALLNIMNTADINGQPLIRVNKAWNQILDETSDPNIASYFAALEETRGFYSALLATGGSAPTENDRKALGILSGNSTPQATAAAIQQLEDAVARRLQSQYQAMQQYNQNLSSGQTMGGSSGGGGFAEAW